MERVGDHPRLLVGTPQAERHEEHMQQAGMIRILDVLLHQLPVARNALSRIAEDHQLAVWLTCREHAIEIPEHVGTEIVFERRHRAIKGGEDDPVALGDFQLVEAMILEPEIGRHSALLADTAPIWNAHQVTLEIVVPLVVRTAEVGVIAEVLLAELHPAMRAPIFDDVDPAVVVANQDHLPLSNERPLEVADVRDLGDETDIGPVRSVEDAFQLALVDLAIGVGAKRDFSQRTLAPQRIGRREVIGDGVHAFGRIGDAVGDAVASEACAVVIGDDDERSRSL